MLADDDRDRTEHSKVFVLGNGLKCMAQKGAATTFGPPAPDEQALVQGREHEFRGGSVPVRARLDDEQVAVFDAELSQAAADNAIDQIVRIRLLDRHADECARSARVDRPALPNRSGKLPCHDLAVSCGHLCPPVRRRSQPRLNPRQNP